MMPIALRLKMADLQLRELTEALDARVGLDVQSTDARVCAAVAAVWPCLPEGARDLLQGVKVSSTPGLRNDGIAVCGCANVRKRQIWICEGRPAAEMRTTVGHELSHIYLKAIGSPHWANELATIAQAAMWGFWES